MFSFGSGQLFVNPIGGNLAANPTPYQLFTLQESSVDISQDLKELKGQNKFADDVAPGDMKVSGKITFGRIDISIFNQIFFANTQSTGIKNIVANEAGTIPSPSGPYTITVTGSANFTTDLGVTYAATGMALTRVASGPTVGQYSVSAGVYTFAAADAAAAVLISYVATASSTGKTIALNNQLMGYGPIFELWLADPYQAVAGKNNGIHLFACRMSKLNQNRKRDNYVVPEMDFMAFANAAGQVGELFQVAP